MAQQLRGETDAQVLFGRARPGALDDRLPHHLVADAISPEVVLERDPGPRSPHRRRPLIRDIVGGQRAPFDQGRQDRGVVAAHLVEHVGVELLALRGVRGQLGPNRRRALLGERLHALEQRAKQPLACGDVGLRGSVACLPRERDHRRDCASGLTRAVKRQLRAEGVRATYSSVLGYSSASAGDPRAPAVPSATVGQSTNDGRSRNGGPAIAVATGRTADPRRRLSRAKLYPPKPADASRDAVLSPSQGSADGPQRRAAGCRTRLAPPRLQLRQPRPLSPLRALCTSLQPVPAMMAG